MANYRLGALAPVIDSDTWIAPGAHVVGQVSIGAQCGVWFGAHNPTTGGPLGGPPSAEKTNGSAPCES